MKNIFTFAIVCSFSKYDRAITIYTEALEIVDTHSSLWSNITSNLAGRIKNRFDFEKEQEFYFEDIHRKKGNYDQARELYLQGLKQVESIHGQNHPSIAEILNHLAVLNKKQGNYTEALEYLKQALRIAKHFFGSEHQDTGIYLTNVGDIYRKVNNL